MELDKINLFNVVKKRLAWIGRRQEIIAQNIANADTPNYRAKDLKPFKFEDLVRRQDAGLRMEVTQKSHLGGSRRRASEFVETEDRKPFETTPTGNAVVLEEQMAKMNESGVSHRLTTELYKKHLNMIKVALGRGR